MLCRAFMMVALAGILLSFSQQTVRAGFEWSPDGKTVYTETPDTRPKMTTQPPPVRQPAPLPATTANEQIFLPLPGQTGVSPYGQVQPQRMPMPAPVPVTIPPQPYRPPPVQNIPPQMPPAAHNRFGHNFEVISGFGNDMPLALALRQIVPANYAFSFGQGVNPGYRVSWTGEKPWNDVVHEMITPLNLVAHVRGRRLYINKNTGAARPMVAPQAPAFPAPQNLRPQQSAYGNMPVTPQYIPNYAAISQEQVNAMATLNKVAQVPRPKPPPLNADGRRDNITDPGQHVRPQPAQTLAKLRRIVNVDRLKQDKARITDVEARADSPIQSPVKSVVPQPLLPERLPQRFEYQTDIMSADPMTPSAHEAHNFWEANRGDSLKSVLGLWSAQAGTELVWQTGRDYQVQSHVFVNGSFRAALKTLLTEAMPAGDRPRIEFFETPGSARDFRLIIHES